MGSIKDWASKALLRADATFLCHGIAVSSDNALAVKQAVHISRMNPYDNASADQTELALLETYLATRDDCPFCLRTAKATSVTKTSASN